MNNERKNVLGATFCNQCGILSNKDCEKICWACDKGEMIYVQTIRDLMALQPSTVNNTHTIYVASEKHGSGCRCHDCEFSDYYYY